MLYLLSRLVTEDSFALDENTAVEAEVSGDIQNKGLHEKGKSKGDGGQGKGKKGNSENLVPGGQASAPSFGGSADSTAAGSASAPSFGGNAASSSSLPPVVGSSVAAGSPVGGNVGLVDLTDDMEVDPVPLNAAAPYAKDGFVPNPDAPADAEPEQIGDEPVSLSTAPPAALAKGVLVHNAASSTDAVLASLQPHLVLTPAAG